MNALTEQLINITRKAYLENTQSLSTTEQIAVSFLLNDLSLLPAGWDGFLEAWIHLGEWQNSVLYIHQNFMASIYSPELNGFDIANGE